MIVGVGAAMSVEALAAASPLCSVLGWMPMSANRFTVACCIAAFAGALPRSWSESSPHDHCTVPPPNTSASSPTPAPLESRYSVRLWVAVPGP